MVKIFYSDAEKAQALAKQSKTGKATGGKAALLQLRAGGKKVVQSGGIKKPGFSAAVPAKRIIANGNNKNGKKPTVVKSATTTKVGTKAKPVAKNKPVKGGKLATALETAIAISNNKKHRNCSEVSELLQAHEKGWIEDSKFIDLLKKYVL